jgi:hypothetical protein
LADDPENSPADGDPSPGTWLRDDSHTPASGAETVCDPSNAPSHLNLPAGVPDVEKPGSAWVGPPAVTHYFPIPLGGKFSGPFATGVFLPNGFTYLIKVDVILFFHGDRDGDYACDHIAQYWRGAYPKKKAAPSGPVTLRKDLNDAGKKSVVLIAPTLGVNPRFEHPETVGDFFEKSAEAQGGFLTKVLHELALAEPKARGGQGSATGFDQEPEVGKIILAAHSAGGRPLLRQAQLMPSNRISEVWAFDALYGTNIPAEYGSHIANAWLDVMIDSPSTKFFFHFGTDWPTKHARKLESLAKERSPGNGTFIEGPTGDHFGVLTKNFSKRLETKLIK